MSMFKNVTSALICSSFALASVGCAVDPMLPSADQGVDDVAAMLGDGATFEVMPSADDSRSDAWLLASGIWLEEGPEAFDAEIGGGAASVRLDGDVLVVSELRVALDGIDHQIPGGASMTDVALVLEAPVELSTEVTGERVSARGTLPLRLDWALATETSIVPLASQDVEALPIVIEARATADGLELTATMQADDTVFELDGLFAIDAIDVSLAAE